MHPIARRAASATGALALVAGLGLAACSQENDGKAADEAPAGATNGSTEPGEPTEAALAGAAWLEGELQGGLLHNREFGTDDHSTTVDLAYALRAVEPESPALTTITEALAEGAEAYTSPGKDVWSGSTGKLLSFAVDQGADPRDFGGLDLVAQLEERTADEGPATGRISDKSEFGDYANGFGQAWAVRGLTLAGSDEADAARGFLLQQQCDGGFFRLYFPEADAEEQACADAKPEPADTTALTYVLLHDLAEDDEELAAALAEGIDYILSQQAEDGSFSGGDGQLVPNANSTGMAGWALLLAGEDEAAAKAAAWVRAHQLGECEGKVGADAGAIAFDDLTLAAAGKRGLTAKTEYQWRLATAQSVPALLALDEDAPEAPCPAAS